MKREETEEETRGEGQEYQGSEREEGKDANTQRHKQKNWGGGITTRMEKRRKNQLEEGCIEKNNLNRVV